MFSENKSVIYIAEDYTLWGTVFDSLWWAANSQGTIQRTGLGLAVRADPTTPARSRAAGGSSGSSPSPELQETSQRQGQAEARLGCQPVGDSQDQSWWGDTWSDTAPGWPGRSTGWGLRALPRGVFLWHHSLLYRITESQDGWGWKGPLDLSGPICLLKRGHLELVDQELVWTAFEYLQGWRLHHLSAQLVSVLSPPHSNKMFPDAQEEPPVFQLVPIAFDLVTLHCTLPSGMYYTLTRSPLSHHFSRLSSPSFLSLSL